MGVVAQLRGMVAAGTAEYTAGTAVYWTDDQLQEVLDRHRHYHPDVQLAWQTQIAAGGSIAYHRGWIQPVGWFNAGTVAATSGTFVTSRGSTVTGWTLHQDGWVTFSADQAGTAVYFRGHSYDVHGAAAEVLETWAGVEKLNFDFDTEGDQGYKRSQKIAQLMALAGEHRRRAVVRTVPTYRQDEWTWRS